MDPNQYSWVMIDGKANLENQLEILLQITNTKLKGKYAQKFVAF